LETQLFSGQQSLCLKKINTPYFSITQNELLWIFTRRSLFDTALLPHYTFPILTIGELSGEVGILTSALRCCEAEGLLEPRGRTRSAGASMHRRASTLYGG
jgi:hypothetical protein